MTAQFYTFIYILQPLKKNTLGTVTNPLVNVIQYIFWIVDCVIGWLIALIS